MALLRKLFYRKPPDGLLEISERVYVFDCCFTTDAWEQEDYKGYVGNTIGQLKDHYPDASILIFNFRDGESSQIASALSEYEMTIMDYPRQYEGCPLLPMEVIHHFLRSSESWLSLGQQNVLLMHCERGGWPVLAFMLAALLIYRKHYTGEYKTLDMVYKQAPRELLQFLSPLNPLPSQLRYLQYVSRRNVATEWPPLDRALTLDCVIIRMIPDFDGNGGCCPIFRIYGQDPLFPGDRTPKLLFSTPKRSKNIRYYKQAECELVKIDINCHVQGDIVLECISLHEDVGREKMMYRAMFNTAFIRSNILMLNRDEIDILWDAKDLFPKDFRAELLFSEMDGAASTVPVDLSCFEEDGLPIEAFAKVQEMFSSVDWLVPKGDAALNVLHQIAASDIVQEKLETGSHQSVEASNLRHVLTRNIYQDKQSTTSSDLAMEKLPSPETDAGGHMSDGQTFGPRREVETQQLSSSLPPKSPSSSSPLSPSLPVEKPRTMHHNSMQYPLASTDPKSSPLPILNEKQAAGTKTPTPVPTSPSPCASSSLSPPTLPSKNQVTSKGQSPVTQSLLPSSQPLQEITDIKVKPPPPPPIADVNESPFHPSILPSSPSSKDIKETKVEPSHLQPSTPTGPVTPPLKEKRGTALEPAPPHPMSHLGQSPFPPSILSPSPSKDNTDTKVSSPQSVSSPPIGPESPFLKEKRVTIPESPQTSHAPENLPSLPTSSVMNDKVTRSGPPPASPLPSTSFGEYQAVKTETSSAAPTAPVPPPPPTPPLKDKPVKRAGPSPPPPPPPPPPLHVREDTDDRVAKPVPPAPRPLAPSSSLHLGSASQISSSPPPPTPPFFSANGKEKTGVVPPPPPSLSRVASMSGAPSPPPPLVKGRGLSRMGSSKNQQAKKLKPLHWLKLTRAVQGSLWAETQKSGEAAKAPEIDMSELESLFSASNTNLEQGVAQSKSRAAVANKPEKVQLIDHRRAYNCEIMLSKVKIPLNELMDYVLALEDSAMDADQVDHLIKFCPTKEEMELLKGYKGEKDKLGKCEQFFLELMKVPRTESKLRVFSFKLQFNSQVSDLRKSLNIVNSAVEEIRSSAKLKRVMQTILSLGNALNQGTARGSAIGFRLDSLLKLTETRTRNNRMTLMHYLCKVLADKLPEVLDFSQDLGSLEPASKIQLKFLAEEMQAISKGLEKVVQELSMAENDGPVSENFRKDLKEFLFSAEGDVRALASLYSGVGKNVDALILYFGEDPSRCPYEQVVSTLLKFVRMFNQAHDENAKQLEAEKKKEASSEKLKQSHSHIESEHIRQSPVKSPK